MPQTIFPRHIKRFKLSNAMLEKGEEFKRKAAQLSEHFEENPTECYGLELRLAGALLANRVEIPTEILTKTSAEIEPYPLHRLFIRPALEPIAHLYWPELLCPRPENDILLAVASCLTGRKLGWRVKSVKSRPDKTGIFTKYPEPDAGCPMISKFWANNMPLGNGDVFDALLRYANFLGVHPLSDGNGRVARVMLQSDLTQMGVLSGPFLSFAPVKYACAPVYLYAIRQLHDNTRESFEYFVSIMLELLTLSCTLYKSI